jgi:aryl-alcohol dehydrogenase-like predicted oxidoreductase
MSTSSIRTASTRHAAGGDDGALDHIVRSGRALYVGISSYNSQRTREAAAILRDLGTPLPHPPAQLQHPEPLGRGPTG